MPTLTMQQIQDLSQDPSRRHAFQQLLRAKGIEASDEDLRNPYSKRYEAYMNSVAILIMEMELIDDLARLNLPVHRTTETQSTKPAYIPEPEKRAQVDEQKGVKSALSIDSFKIESLLKELQKDIAEYVETQQVISNLTQQMQTAQVELDTLNEQIAVAQTLAQHQATQQQPVVQPQQTNRTVPPIAAIPPHTARMIPQHSEVVKKNNVQSKHSVIQPYKPVKVEELREQKTRIEHRLIDISGLTIIQVRRSEVIRQRAEEKYVEIRRQVPYFQDRDNRFAQNLRSGKYDDALENMIAFLHSRGRDSYMKQTLGDLCRDYNQFVQNTNSASIPANSY